MKNSCTCSGPGCPNSADEVDRADGVDEEKLNPGNEIRIWMLRKGMKLTDVARDLEMRVSNITHFLNGELTSIRLMTYLFEKGCPPELLCNEWIGAKRRKGKMQAHKKRYAPRGSRKGKKK